MARRSGQFIKYIGVGAFIVGIFMIASFVYVAFIDDLSRTTQYKSQAAFDRLGVLEEVMHADCATDARAVFRINDIRSGDLACITSDRTVRLSFQIDVAGTTEVHNYSILNSAVESLPAGEQLATGTEKVNTYSIAVLDKDQDTGEVENTYRGIMKMAVSGSGWQCHQLPGRCIAYDDQCARTAIKDCGTGRVCCRLEEAVGSGD